MKALPTLSVLAVLLGGLRPSAMAQAPALTTFPVGTGANATTVTVSALATGLNTPWELVWGPDNFIWMTERSGRISRVNPTTGQVLPLLNVPDVTENNESGLLGMALHPQFAANPYIYIVYNYTVAGALREKLVRYTYTAGATGTAGTLTAPLVLLGNLNATTTHSGSRVLIMPDLTLLMTTGDAQIVSDAQNPASLNGKVLRMNLDGSVPADNPTPGSLIYTLGHRNPQGLVQLPNGRIYSSEHGPDDNDEVNRIEAGRNYGWPNVHGYCDVADEQSFCATNNVREPLTAWTPTIAPAGLTYYDSPAIPAWRGSLLLAILKARMLAQLPLDAAGNIVNGKSPQPMFLPNFGRLRAICVSPQGKVYVATSNKDGHGGTVGPTDDRILTLENRAYTATAATKGTTAVGLTLFPNPARHQVRITLPAAGAQVVLLDATGRRVRTLTVAGTSAELSLAGLQAGLYLVQATTAAGVSTQRLLVESE